MSAPSVVPNRLPGSVPFTRIITLTCEACGKNTGATVYECGPDRVAYSVPNSWRFLTRFVQWSECGTELSEDGFCSEACMLQVIEREAIQSRWDQLRPGKPALPAPGVLPVDLAHTLEVELSNIYSASLAKAEALMVEEAGPDWRARMGEK